MLDFTAYFLNLKQFFSRSWFCLRITCSQTVRRQTRGDGNKNGAAKASVANMLCGTLMHVVRSLSNHRVWWERACILSLPKFQRSKTLIQPHNQSRLAARDRKRSTLHAFARSFCDMTAQCLVEPSSAAGQMKHQI